MKHLPALAGLVVLAAIAACAASPPPEGDAACRREPSGGVLAAIEGMQEPRYARTLSGTIVSVEAGQEGRPGRIAVRPDGTEEIVRILYRDPAGRIPLPPGRHFELRVETVGGFPGASALLASDENGLAFAAAADDAPGRAVLRGGVPGFTIRFQPAHCPSRRADRCYAALVNRPLEIGHAGAVAVLMHGDHATLGNYRIDCFASQQVEYRKGCSDAGLVELAYRIVRSDLAGDAAATGAKGG